MNNRFTAVAVYISLLLSPASVSSAEPSGPVTRTGVTAHRGYSSAYVENTLPAFEQALSLNVDWVECDIFLSADDQIVVTHDMSTLRLTGIEGSIGSLTYEQIQRLDTAVDFRHRNGLDLDELPPHRIPLLSEVLDLVMKQSAIRFSIQPKDESTEAAITIIREKGAEAWVGFNDGNLQKMKTVKELAPSVPVFWDRPNDADVSRDIQIAREQGFESLVYNQDYVTKNAIEIVQDAGIEYGVWTVNDSESMKRFILMGVDRLYTNYPVEALTLFQQFRN